MATYTNLPPGHYVYRVEVSRGDWHKESFVELHIVQQAHFYRELWFVVLCVILIAALVWLFHRQRLHQLAVRYSVVAEERNRVAREMHDTILQGCIGISFLLDGIESNRQAQAEKDDSRSQLSGQSWAALKLARTEIEKTIREARAAIWNLRSAESEAQLGQSLRDLLDKMTNRLSIPTTFQTSGPSLRLTHEQQHEILMAVREALQNVIKHAGGSDIALSLRYRGNLVTIEIKDRGCGISHELNGSKNDGHFGVVGMRERMARIGGTCRILSSDGEGTTVILEVPINAAPRASGLFE
ncbi:MAG: sensor histidine kinase [Terracidiphilus sp.]